jgi:hypothetical protein
VSYLGVPVSALDIDRYDEIEFYDLCQLAIIQAEDRERLEDEIDKEWQQLRLKNRSLNYDDEFDRFLIDTATLELRYVTALRRLELARRQNADMIPIRLFASQTKICALDRLVHCLSTEADLRNTAYHGGVSIKALRMQYAA